MGTTTVYPVTPTYTGAALTKYDNLTSNLTVIIDSTTAQGVLNLGKMVVTFENYSTTASTTVTLKAGDTFSDYHIGDVAACTISTATTAISTACTIVFGGKQFESARFLESDEQIEFTLATGATVYISAVMLP